MRITLLLGAVALFVASGLTSGCAPAPPTTVGVGTPVARGNWQYAVIDVSKQESVPWTDFGNTFDAKGTWLILNMQMKNIGRESYPINTWDFKVKDNAGNNYDPSSFESAMYSQYKGKDNPWTDYPPGVAVDTIILFDVNPEAKGLKLNLAQANVDIDLGG